MPIFRMYSILDISMFGSARYGLLQVDIGVNIFHSDYIGNSIFLTLDSGFSKASSFGLSKIARI